MSAFIVSKAHIDAMVHVALDLGFPRLVPEVANMRPFEFGKMLIDENVASVEYRYRDSDSLPGPVDEYYNRNYSLKINPNFKYQPAKAISAINCYEYQSCEHPDWKYSLAYRVCRRMCDLLIEKVIDESQNEVWEVDSLEQLA